VWSAACPAASTRQVQHDGRRPGRGGEDHRDPTIRLNGEDISPNTLEELDAKVEAIAWQVRAPGPALAGPGGG
jgi:hypothetical protein